MELILWRHGDAEKAAGNLPDAKRPLTTVGRKQAQTMAHWLQPRLPKRTQILVCPSVRARQTADCLELPYKVERQVGIGAAAPDLLAAAHWPEGRDPVLIVCHQPGIGRLASLFLGGSDETEMPVKKCGVLWFSTREREHRMQLVLRAVMYPDMV